MAVSSQSGSRGPGLAVTASATCHSVHTTWQWVQSRRQPVHSELQTLWVWRSRYETRSDAVGSRLSIHCNEFGSLTNTSAVLPQSTRRSLQKDLIRGFDSNMTRIVGGIRSGATGSEAPRKQEPTSEGHRISRFLWRPSTLDNFIVFTIYSVVVHSRCLDTFSPPGPHLLSFGWDRRLVHLEQTLTSNPTSTRAWILNLQWSTFLPYLSIRCQ